MRRSSFQAKAANNSSSSKFDFSAGVPAEDHDSSQSGGKSLKRSAGGAFGADVSSTSKNNGAATKAKVDILSSSKTSSSSSWTTPEGNKTNAATATTSTSFVTPKLVTSSATSSQSSSSASSGSKISPSPVINNKNNNSSGSSDNNDIATIAHKPVHEVFELLNDNTVSTTTTNNNYNTNAPSTYKQDVEDDSPSLILQEMSSNVPQQQQQPKEEEEEEDDDNDTSSALHPHTPDATSTSTPTPSPGIYPAIMHPQYLSLESNLMAGLQRFVDEAMVDLVWMMRKETEIRLSADVLLKKCEETIAAKKDGMELILENARNNYRRLEGIVRKRVEDDSDSNAFPDNTTSTKQSVQPSEAADAILEAATTTTTSSSSSFSSVSFSDRQSNVYSYTKSADAEADGGEIEHFGGRNDNQEDDLKIED